MKRAAVLAFAILTISFCRADEAATLAAASKALNSLVVPALDASLAEYRRSGRAEDEMRVFKLKQDLKEIWRELSVIEVYSLAANTAEAKGQMDVVKERREKVREAYFEIRPRIEQTLKILRTSSLELDAVTLERLIQELSAASTAFAATIGETEDKMRKSGEPGATDNPGDAQ